MRKSILFFSLLVPALFSACVKPLEEMSYNASVAVACDEPTLDWTHQVTVSGRIVEVVGPEVGNRGFVYGSTPDPVIGDWQTIYCQGDTFEASFQRPAGDHCYVRAFATTSNGTTYSSQYDVLSDVDFAHLNLDDFTAFDCSTQYVQISNVRTLLVTENITSVDGGGWVHFHPGNTWYDYDYAELWIGYWLGMGLDGVNIPYLSWNRTVGEVQCVYDVPSNPELQMRFTRTNIGFLIEFSDYIKISKIVPAHDNTVFCSILRYTQAPLN